MSWLFELYKCIVFYGDVKLTFICSCGLLLMINWAINYQASIRATFSVTGAISIKAKLSGLGKDEKICSDTSPRYIRFECFDWNLDLEIKGNIFGLVLLLFFVFCRFWIVRQTSLVAKINQYWRVLADAGRHQHHAPGRARPDPPRYHSAADEEHRPLILIGRGTRNSNAPTPKTNMNTLVTAKLRHLKLLRSLGDPDLNLCLWKPDIFNKKVESKFLNHNF